MPTPLNLSKFLLFIGLSTMLFGCGLSEKELQELRANATPLNIPGIPENLETITWEKSPNNAAGLIFLEGKTVYELRRYSRFYFIDPTTKHYISFAYGCLDMIPTLEWTDPSRSRVIAYRPPDRTGKRRPYLLRVENLQTGRVVAPSYAKCSSSVAETNK